MRNQILVLLAIVLLIGGAAYAGSLTALGNSPVDMQQFREDIVYAVNNKTLADPDIGYNSSSKANLELGNSITVICAGKFNAVTASNTLTFSSGHATVPASSKCIFAFGVDADDDFYTKQSPIVTYDHQLVIPKFDDGIAMLGTVKVESNSSGAFIPNTTAMDDSDLTVTFTDYYNLPLSLNINQR